MMMFNGCRRFEHIANNIVEGGREPVDGAKEIVGCEMTLFQKEEEVLEFIVEEMPPDVKIPSGVRMNLP